MVKKLIKYDFMSFFRLLLPVQLIIIGIAAINRIVQIFENNGTAYRIAFTSSSILLGVACIVGIVMCVIIAIVRFYQGLYSNEGYLSQTLPVTPAQHIWSKMLVSILFELGTFLAIFIALNVATLGDVGVEVYKALGYTFKELVLQVKGHAFLFVLEAIVFVLVSEATSLLLFYFCISIGQLVNRKKILLAFGVFFGLYVLVQIVFTIIIIIGMTNPEYWENLFRPLLVWANGHRIAAVHMFMWSTIVLDAVFGLIFFLVSRTIMTKRLNLT